jgi:hypothetical protein
MFAPALTYPAPTYAPRQPAQPPAVPANAPRAAAATRPQPVIRAQAPEEPKPARPPLLTLPSPEQLGVTLRPVENANDWTALHARMKELGIVSFHLESLSAGQARFTCWLPLDKPGLTQRIEAVADSELAAAQLALERAGQARAGHP